MGSLERRIEDLERLHSIADHAEDPEYWERRRAAFRATLRRAEEKSVREEAEGDPRRRHALEDLSESMRRRVADR